MINALGKIGIYTNDDQLVYFGLGQRVIPYRQTKCASVENLSSGDDGVPIFVFTKAATVISTSCFTSGTAFTTTPAYQLRHGSATGTALTGADICDPSPLYTAVTAGGVFAANEALVFNVTNTPAPTIGTWTMVCINYTENLQ